MAILPWGIILVDDRTCITIKTGNGVCGKKKEWADRNPCTMLWWMVAWFRWYSVGTCWNFVLGFLFTRVLCVLVLQCPRWRNCVISPSSWVELVYLNPPWPFHFIPQTAWPHWGVLTASVKARWSIRGVLIHVRHLSCRFSHKMALVKCPCAFRAAQPRTKCWSAGLVLRTFSL